MAEPIYRFNFADVAETINYEAYTAAAAPAPAATQGVIGQYGGVSATLFNQSNATSYLADLFAGGFQGHLTAPPTVEFAPDIVETTIDHVDRSSALLKRHLGLLNLARVRLDDATNRDSLNRRLAAFLDKWDDDEDVRALLGPYYTRTPRTTAGGGVIQINRRAELAENQVKGQDDNDSSALFKLSRHAMDDFHSLAGQRTTLERLQRIKAVARAESTRRSFELDGEIVTARAEHANAERDRLAAEEDYTLVRGLLTEQLEAVDEAFAERVRILSNPVGLCFARVDDLPVSISYRQTALVPRPDPGRLPNACTATRTELPERLAPFLELLADQPMSAWRMLAADWHRLPAEWVYQPPVRSLPTYVERIRTMPAVFSALAVTLPVPMMTALASVDRGLSQAVLVRNAADRITLEQLTASRNGALRIKARALQDDLATALGCIVARLTELPASTRFTWSRLAEDDALAVERPASWPGMEPHRRQTSGLVLAQTICWLVGQLADNAPADARTAIRTALRACLLHAVNDDPADLLVGDVVQFPGLFRPGAVLTANLNRIPPLQAVVKVYDGDRRLIGEARVIDSRETSAQVQVIATHAAPAVFAAWTVVG
jgi:hypothetical protein